MSDPRFGKGSAIIRGNTFRNGPVGIQIGAGIQAEIDGNQFENVHVPFVIDPSARISITGTRISDDPKLRSDKNSGSKIGWRRMKGPPLPAYCSECETIFPSANYTYAGAYFNSWDNEEPCPNCKNDHAKVSEGLFDLSGEYIRVISAPEFTFEIIGKLGDISNAYLSNKIGPEEAIVRFDQVSSAFGSIAKRAQKYGLAGLAMLATLATIDSYRLSREQTELAREQTAMAREALNLQKAGSSPLTREEAIDILSHYRFTPSEIVAQPQQAIEGKRRDQCSAREAPTETGSIKLTPNGKPKARDLRRSQRKARRQAFRGDR